MHATHDQPTTLGTGPAQPLREAADYLHRHGWCQHAHYGDDTRTPPADVVGALAITCFGYPTTDLHFDDGMDDVTANDISFVLACLVLATFIGIDDMIDAQGVRVDYSLVEWNDEPYQSLGAVTAVLRAAADDFDTTGGLR
jgi:hypothetical protein